MRYQLLFMLIVLSEIQAKVIVNLCTTEDACSNKGNPCQCYTIQGCGPRQKQGNDIPTWSNDDFYANNCYCNRSDLDNVDTCEA